MIKKIQKEISKLEQQKELKTNKKLALETEIKDINEKLKSLNVLKTQYEKIQSGVDNFFNAPAINEDIIEQDIHE